MSKNKKIYLIVFIAVVLIATTSLIYYRINENIKSSTKPQKPPQAVQIITPSRGDISGKLLFSGDILAVQQTNIYSRITGNIQKMYADIGDYVSKGRLLAVIDKSTLYQTVRQTEGLLNQAAANLENNRVNLERIQKLFEKGLTYQSHRKHRLKLQKQITTMRFFRSITATSGHLSGATLQKDFLMRVLSCHRGLQIQFTYYRT